MAWTTSAYGPREKSDVESAIEWYFKREIESYRKDSKRCAIVIVFKNASVEHLPESKLSDLVQAYQEHKKKERAKAEKHMAILSSSSTHYEPAGGGGGVGYATLSWSTALKAAINPGSPFYYPTPASLNTERDAPELTKEEKKQKNKYSDPRL